MEIRLEAEADFCKTKDELEMPPSFVSITSVEDSGYLSQGQCSPFNETQCASNNVPLHSSDSVCSFRSNEGISTSLNSMELDDFTSLETAILEPQSNVFIKPLDSSSEVYQSTPASKKLCVHMHKEFEFATPLPGPSNNASRISLVGQHNTDILSHLSKLNILPPLHKILSYLEPEDLCQIRLVSSYWRKLLSDFPHMKTWQQFVRVKRENKENSLLNTAKPEDNRDLLVTPLSTRGQLRDIHNFVLVPTTQSNHSPPVSPSKMHSSRYFKEGQKLKTGEKLRKCPKCAWPARADNNKTGVRCTGRHCGFHFCMDCSGPFHGSKSCAKTTPVTPTKARHYLKLNNKKKLHRLLL